MHSVSGVLHGLVAKTSGATESSLNFLLCLKNKKWYESFSDHRLQMQPHFMDLSPRFPRRNKYTEKVKKRELFINTPTFFLLYFSIVSQFSQIKT